MMNGCPRWSFLTVPLLAALGCSDPVPRPNKGNALVSIQKPTTGSLNCPVPGKTYQVGNPKPPNNMNIGDLFTEGENGAKIKCSVKGSGPYTFSGSIQAASSEKAPVSVTFTNGVVNADKLTGTATVSVYTPELAGSFTSDAGACAINIVNQNIKGGSMWATFSCPIVSEPSTGKACSIGPVDIPISTIVFEDCDGSP